MLILTIDVGGTAIKSAIYNEKGKLKEKYEELPTDVTTEGNRISEQVLSLCERAMEEFAINGVAIATAGIVNSSTGEIIYAGPNITDYVSTNLKQQVESTYDLPCIVENDANAAALGEWWIGSAQNSESALCITLGTGLGGAMVLNGKIWRGAKFSAGEIGYLPLNDNNYLEQVASTKAMLADFHNKTGEKINGRVFFERFKQGDQAAQDALTKMMDALAQGLSSVVYLFSPDVIVVGGGIASQKEIIMPMLQKTLSQKLVGDFFMPNKITPATLGNSAGMLGALYCFLKAQNKA